MNFAQRGAGLVHNMSKIWSILQIYSQTTLHLERLLKQPLCCGTFELCKRHRLRIIRYFGYARIA